MKNKKTPLVLRKGFVMGASVVFGAIMGGLISAMGQNTGSYHGRVETNEMWKTGLDEVLKKGENKSEEEGKEE